MEHCKVLKNEDGVEIEFKIRAECSTYEDMQKALSFIAKSSHNFYLEVARKINSTL